MGKRKCSLAFRKIYVDRVRVRPVDPGVLRVERTRVSAAKEKPLRRVLSSSLYLCSGTPSAKGDLPSLS